MDQLSATNLRRHWWRVPAIGLLAAMIAYLASFAVPATYGSSTKLLIRGRDTTVLSSTGQDLTNQPGVVDSTLAKALSETQSALLGSRTVAEQVVDRLHLADKPKETGVVHALKGALAGSIKRTRAYLTHGFYKEPARREAKIVDVAGGLSAHASGDSYVIDLKGSGSTPEEARDVTNAAADVLVELSNARARTEAAMHRDALKVQLDRAWTQQLDAEKVVADYKRTHDISDLDTELSLTASSAEDLRGQLRTTDADLSGARAELATTQQQLAATPATQSSSTKIVTGRSSTEVAASSENGTYVSLQSNLQRLQAQISGLEARRDALQRALNQNPSTASALSETEAGLRQLQLQSSVAGEVVKSLNAKYQAAASTAESSGVELTRLDAAGLPNYPLKPTRWLYLVLGLVFGSVAGFAWSYVRLRRQGLLGSSAPADLFDDEVAAEAAARQDDEVIDLRPAQVPVGAAHKGSTHSGSSNHASHGAGNGAVDYIDLTSPPPEQGDR